MSHISLRFLLYSLIIYHFNIDSHINIFMILSKYWVRGFYFTERECIFFCSRLTIRYLITESGMSTFQARYFIKILRLAALYPSSFIIQWKCTIIQMTSCESSCTIIQADFMHHSPVWYAAPNLGSCLYAVCIGHRWDHRRRLLLIQLSLLKTSRGSLTNWMVGEL